MTVTEWTMPRRPDNPWHRLAWPVFPGVFSSCDAAGLLGLPTGDAQCSVQTRTVSDRPDIPNSVGDHRSQPAYASPHDLTATGPDTHDKILQRRRWIFRGFPSYKPHPAATTHAELCHTSNISTP